MHILITCESCAAHVRPQTWIRHNREGVAVFCSGPAFQHAVRFFKSKATASAPSLAGCTAATLKISKYGVVVTDLIRRKPWPDMDAEQGNR